jgi:hypothetical protein
LGAEKTGTPEDDKTRRRRARGKIFKVSMHLPPSVPDRMLGGNDNLCGHRSRSTLRSTRSRVW